MGGTCKNIRNKKKMQKVMPTMPDPFTCYDMCYATGISPRRCAILLRQFPEVRFEPRKNSNGVGHWHRVS